MQQEVKYCTSFDGARIAYASIGSGAPLVISPSWLGHLAVEWDQPQARRFLERLGQGRRLIRYDKRGIGLSDRDVSDMGFEARVRDLEAVVSAAGAAPCDLIGMSEGGPTAIGYTAMHPENVHRLVLYGAYPRLEVSVLDIQALLALMRSQWGMGSAAIASLFLQTGSPTEVAEFIALEKAAATGENAARTIEEIVKIDVTDVLAAVRAPTLILHRVDDAIHPLDLAREMAAKIPDSRLVALPGDLFPPQYGDSDRLIAEIRSFLGEPESTAADGAQSNERRRFRTVLFTDLVGHTEMMRRLGDERGRDVLREHERMTRELLKRHGGSEIKTDGDSFMVSFDSVTAAMDCAIALQCAFAARNQDGGEPLEVRVGLNAGEPIEEDGDLFGSTVIMASRVAAKAGAGEILIPEPLRHLLTGKSYVYADRGETMLKGFEDAVRLYEVRWRE